MTLSDRDSTGETPIILKKWGPARAGHVPFYRYIYRQLPFNPAVSGDFQHNRQNLAAFSRYNPPFNQQNRITF